MVKLFLPDECLYRNSCHKPMSLCNTPGCPHYEELKNRKITSGLIKSKFEYSKHKHATISV